MAPHSSTLAWKIPWMEEPGGLQFMGSLRVGHDWATSLSCIGEGNSNPLQCSCLENPRNRGAWWAAIYGVTQSQTQLMWLSSSSSIALSGDRQPLLRVLQVFQPDFKTYTLISLSYFLMLFWRITLTNHLRTFLRKLEQCTEINTPADF